MYPPPLSLRGGWRELRSRKTCRGVACCAQTCRGTPVWVPSIDGILGRPHRAAPTKNLEVAANCGHLSNLKYSRSLPYAFTEHGTIMLASVLNSKAAVYASVQVVRAFVRLREILASHKDLAHKLTELEKKYDHQFKVVFDAIRQLMTPPPNPKRKIGFV